MLHDQTYTCYTALTSCRKLRKLERPAKTPSTYYLPQVFWAFLHLLVIPQQLNLSPVNPLSQIHMKDPIVLLQVGTFIHV